QTKSFLMTRDIDLANFSMKPIDIKSDRSNSFDGGNFWLKNFAYSLNDPATSCPNQAQVGMSIFGRIEGFNMRNLNINTTVNITAAGSCTVGGLSWLLQDANLSHVTVTGSITVQSEAANEIGGASLWAQG